MTRVNGVALPTVGPNHRRSRNLLGARIAPSSPLLAGPVPLADIGVDSRGITRYRTSKGSQELLLSA